MDYGQSWRQILYDLCEGEMTFRTPYMKPEYNGGHSLIHWLSDFKINPFDDREAWFNTGTGVFRTRNLKDDVCRFADWCDGIEETVHLNVYSMPSGSVQVIDILGDLGGFAFEEIDRPCENSFADDQGNRYITCINADFSDEHPQRLIVTPRGNWTGKTLGGLILSTDQGKTFERLPMPFGLTADLDEALHGMERPNVNSGWVAMSPDGRNIVWGVAEGICLPVRRLIVSHDGGRSFACCRIYKKGGELKTAGGVKVFSDRTDSSLFYGFGMKHIRFFTLTGTYFLHLPVVKPVIAGIHKSKPLEFHPRMYQTIGKTAVWQNFHIRNFRIHRYAGKRITVENRITRIGNTIVINQRFKPESAVGHRIRQKTGTLVQIGNTFIRFIIYLHFSAIG